jgi:hypothetical protein
MAQKKYLPAAQPAAPTGLTVSPDPQNGTVLHLTWRDNADNKAFEVDNTVERRDASARPGTGTVHYTWTGLRPGSRACFRVRASDSDTFSSWDPSAGSKCATTSNPSRQPRPCTPTINTAGPFKAKATATLKITGSCFGTRKTVSGADTAYFRISDLTAGWNACWTGDPGTDLVTCKISSWANTTIIFSGFTSNYGNNGWIITSGDHMEIQVWNPQSGKGPASCKVIAGGSAPAKC